MFASAYGVCVCMCYDNQLRQELMTAVTLLVHIVIVLIFRF